MESRINTNGTRSVTQSCRRVTFPCTFLLKVASDAYRNFRFASVLLDALRYCRNDEDMMAALCSPPTTIEEMYLKNLLSIEEKNKEVARIVFRWLYVAQEPLTLSVLAAVPGIEMTFNPNDILKICTSALVCTRQQGLEFVDTRLYLNEALDLDRGDYEVIEFSHSSVKPFLASLNDEKYMASEASYFLIDEQTAHEEVAQPCISRLLQHDELRVDDLESFSHLDIYAACHSIQHLRLSGAFNDIQDRLADLIVALFDPTNGSAYYNWVRLHDDRSDDLETSSPV